MDSKQLEGSEFILGDKVIWRNPPGLGHFAIKLRKQLLEEQIVERMLRRQSETQRVGENVPVADNQQETAAKSK